MTMTTVLDSPRGRGVARCAAGIAVGCAVGHLVLLNAPEHGRTPAGLTAMLVLAVGCLVCARHLWVAPGVRAWLLLATMNAVMLAVMTPMSHQGYGHAAHHAYPGVAPAAHSSSSTLMAALTAFAVVQIVCAATMLAWYRRVVAARLIGRRS